MEAELAEVTHRLLDAIGQGDWEAYVQLSHPAMTCFEPEAKGELVHGLPFHQTYFETPGGGTVLRQTVCGLRVWPLGEGAAVAYTRLVQGWSAETGHWTRKFEETRVWRQEAGAWRQVHVHRSAPA
jgi:calcium/calmodulin-dependent protein kinase (CaM kinase) II